MTEINQSNVLEKASSSLHLNDDLQMAAVSCTAKMSYKNHIATARETFDKRKITI
jgi:hypothetical protein